jgi:heparan-sulfate lyase
LLRYYRTRQAPGHPDVGRYGREKAEGLAAAAEDLAVADDALRNILITAPVYPRFDFGQKIDWLTNRSPVGDLEWIVQLNRQYSWDALGQAYWHTGDEKYAQAYCRQLADWLESCPLADKKDEKGYWAWRMLEVGIRGQAWTGHFNRFLDSPSFTPELLVRQLNSFYEHAERLTRGRDFTRNNWGLMEAEGAAFIAITFPEFKLAPAWRRKAITHLGQEIHRQILPDGMQAEMCFGYHAGCIQWLNRTFQLARLNGLEKEFPADYSQTIERMYEVAGRCAHPNGCSSMFGDDRPDSLMSTVAAGSREFPDNATLKFLATRGQEGRAPPTAFALPDAGLYSLRNDWTTEAIHLILKCGRDGGWHCQSDNGTFELFAFGRYLMPDSGCYIYSGDEKGRAWFRQTHVHQTLTLDGQDSAYAARQLLWQPGDALDALVVENAGYKDLRHRRAVFFVRKKFFVIVDEALGPGAGDVDLHFQLAPGSRPAIDRQAMTVRTGFDKGANLLLQALPQPGLALEDEEGQVSLAYGQKEPRPAFRFRLKKDTATAGLRFVTLLVPYQGKAPKTRLALVGPTVPGADQIELDVTVGPTTCRIGYDLKAGTATLR